MRRVLPPTQTAGRPYVQGWLEPYRERWDLLHEAVGANDWRHCPGSNELPGSSNVAKLAIRI
jgi:hypothetical protein